MARYYKRDLRLGYDGIVYQLEKVVVGSDDSSNLCLLHFICYRHGTSLWDYICIAGLTKPSASQEAYSFIGEVAQQCNIRLERKAFLMRLPG